MSTNKKITQLDELTPATWADDDVIAIVDISAQETKKIQLSTFRTAVGGVTTLTATTPLTVDTSLGDVTISVAISGGGTVNAVLDEDNMASNSPTALSTQQSIKAYVDSQIITVDSLSEVLALGNTTGGTNLIVSSGDVLTTNTINETTAASGVTIETVLIKDGEVVATGFTGTLDGVLGGGTPAAITGTALTLTTGATVTTVLDEDNMASNSATALATQQSIKAYVDAEVGTVDTLAEVLALGNTTGGTDIAISIGDKVTNFTSTGIDDNATSTAITIDSSENVGIGTASPTAELDIESTSPEIHLNDSDGVLGAAVTSRMIFQASGSTQGVVGLGTSSGTMAVTNSQGNLLLQADTNNAQASSYVGFTVDNAEKMRITSAGLVGIGTASPSSTLDIVDSVTNPIQIKFDSNASAASGRLGVGSTGNAIAVFDDNTVLESRTGGLALGIDNNNPILFYNTSSRIERMRIDSAGNVGIGTTAPGDVLTVTTATQYKGFTLTNGTNFVAQIVGFGAGNDSGGLKLHSGGVAKVQILTTGDTFFNGGDVGIGTAAPAVPLDVVGNIRSSTGVLFGTDTAAANLLDDYEEGDWTPTIGTGATVSSDAAYNSGFTGGQYTKVGRIVHCTATLRLTDKGTQSGNISILGLPFASANNVKFRATWSSWFHGAADIDLTGNTAGTIMMYQAHNTSYIQVRVKDPATAAGENVQFADISDTVYVQISGSYVAA